jgi:ATPase family associated with various cellular activities (AAA)/Winged helix domain, variant
MSATTAINWDEKNKRYLMARLSAVREMLTAHASREQVSVSASGSTAAAAAIEAARKDLPGPAALDRVCSVFELSSFERDVLLLSAAVELDSTFAELCASAHGDPHRRYPTFSLALAALAEPHWSALTPAAPLRCWRLIELGLGDSLTNSPLRIDERMLHYLLGIPCLDARLHGLVEPLEISSDIPPSHREIAAQITQLWSRVKDIPNWPIISLCGADQHAKLRIAAAACEHFEIPLRTLYATDVPSMVGEREALARLWERESALGGGALFIDAEQLENNRALVCFLENVRGMLFISSREPLQLHRRELVRFEIRKPSPAEQRALWEESLAANGVNLNGQLDQLVSQFNMDAHTIHAISLLAGPVEQGESANGNEAANSDSRGLFEPIWEACRAQGRSRLEDLAQRIPPVSSWDDIVLPQAQRQILRDIATHVRQRTKVCDDWGFAEKGSRGLGISALFCGASGTGKTMAAEILANELHLDLYRIDLSQVVSKYIGETEKNLRRVFDAAEESGAILLFDEADALFGKRSEVRDSHDRYANIEVSYLLQRMESYRGLAILTTNMKNTLDSAFLRRLRFIVQFPFPDSAQRAEIWRRIFPSGTPTEKVDVVKLSRLNLPGGNIRNIALHAAFLAADAAEPVRMSHLLRACRGEYAKLEKSLTESEIANWLT